MNRKQKKIILVGAILIALMIVFPPWKETMDTQEIKWEKSVGYALILTPPTPED